MFATLVMLLAIGPVPQTISVGIEPLPFDPDAWKSSAQVELRVEEQGRAVVYSGVPLARVLGKHLKAGGTMKEMRALADAVILIKAADGYQVAISAVAAAMDPKGERYLLAFGRDGKPLDDKHEPAQMVVPADPKHMRWIRMIKSLHLVRLRGPE